MKINKRNFFTSFLFILFFILYYFVLSNYKMGTKETEIRYYALLFICIISLIILFFRKNLSKCYSKNFFLMLPFGFFLLIISILKAKQAGMNFSFRTVVQIFLTIVPAIYAFAIINLYNIKDTIKMMKILLFITIITYFSIENHTLFDFFLAENWKNFNLLSSNNNFIESALCSEVFLQLFFFFLYFKNITLEEKEKKSISICCIISCIFTLLSFKRLAIFTCAFFVLFNRIIDYKIKKDQENKKNLLFNPIIISIFFCLLTIIYTKFMSKEILTNIDVYKFTNGRDYILELWKNKNFFSFGYGTSMLIIGRYLEMDLVQIYLELGVVSLFIFTYVFFYCTNKNKYSYLIMIYAFINMLTASSLPYLAGWIITFITIGNISSNKLVDEGYKMNDNKLQTYLQL